MLIPKAKFIRDKKHLAFIRSLGCLTEFDHHNIFSNNPTVRQNEIMLSQIIDPAHQRLRNVCGVGLTPSDENLLPLCRVCHTLQHKEGEEEFFRPYLGYKRANTLNKALYAVTGDRDKAMELINEWKAEINDT